MAAAMASERNSPDVRKYYKIAATLDAAIRARRTFDT